MKRIYGLGFLLIFLFVFSFFAYATIETNSSEEGTMVVLADSKEMEEWKFVVSIKEKIEDKEQKGLSACKSALENALAESGNYVVEQRYVNNRIFNDLMRGSSSTAKKLEKTIKADILIIGEAQSELLSKDPIIETEYVKLYSARATGTFKVFWLKDGDIVANITDAYSAADVTPAAANEKALQTLGEVVGKRIAEQILTTKIMQSAE